MLTMDSSTFVFELPRIADTSSVSARFDLEVSPPSLTFNKDAIISTMEVSGVNEDAADAVVDISGLFPNIALEFSSSFANRRRSSMERVIK